MPTCYVAIASELVHEGVLNVVERASQLGKVVVGVLSDEAVAAYKRVPLMDQAARMRVWASVRGVDRVVPQGEMSYRTNLEALRPDYVVHGDDWREGPLAAVRAEVIDVISAWGGYSSRCPTRGASPPRRSRRSCGSSDAPPTAGAGP